jgi:hypothetical protein
MRLTAPTELLRVTVDQQGRSAINAIALGDGPVLAPATQPGLRRVTVMTPDAPRVLLSIDEAVAVAGLNRTQYKWPVLPPSATIFFHLGPEQAVYASAEQGGGMATFAMLVEHLED